MNLRLDRLVVTLLDRYLRREFIHFVAVAVLVVLSICLFLMFTTRVKQGTIFGPALGADYAGFYMAGTLLNNFSTDRLYDLKLQDSIFHQVQPSSPPDEVLTYVHAPFFALLFQPLARLPYVLSFAIWIIFSVALSFAGLVLMLRSASAIPATDRCTALLLAMSFEPLVMECWLGGQASGFGMFWMALALACERLGRPFAAGLALGVLSYKPTLLTLILPMLVISRRWRMLGGLALCTLSLMALSLAIVGWHGFVGYIEDLLYYARIVSGTKPFFRTPKYTDILSFLKLILGVASPFAWPLALALTTPPLIALAAMWAGVIRGGQDSRSLAFATTLTWTPVLNPYGAIYDTVLIIPGLLLTADILYRRSLPGQATLPVVFSRLLAILHITAWISPLLAFRFGFQPLTIALAAMGTYQVLLVLEDRHARSDDCRLVERVLPP